MPDRLQGEYQIAQIMIGAPTYARIGWMRLLMKQIVELIELLLG
jgi:hypothetical protein